MISHEEESRKIRIRYGIAMVLFFIGEIGPIPLMPALGLIVILFRPRWFVRHVHRIYCTKSFRKTNLEPSPSDAPKPVQ